MNERQPEAAPPVAAAFDPAEAESAAGAHAEADLADDTSRALPARHKDAQDCWCGRDEDVCEENGGCRWATAMSEAEAGAAVAELRLAFVSTHLPAILDALRMAAADAEYGARAKRFMAALTALGGDEEETSRG